MLEFRLKIKISFIALALILAAILLYPREALALIGKVEENKNPRLANYFLDWSISDSETQELAKWDLLVLDMEVQENSRQNLIKLKQLNPKIIILAYITSQEIRHDSLQNPSAKLRKKLFTQIDESWWLKNESAQKLSSWPNTWLLNLTDNPPMVNGRRWNSFLPKFVKENILATGLWDGVFYDNLWHDISWINNGQIDINNDGSIEAAAEFNGQWINGVITLLETSRSLIGDDYLVMANGSSYDGYQSYLNGMMFESFPTPWERNGQWQEVIQSYFRVRELNRSPRLSIINTTSKNSQNYLKMRNGLVSSLLTDAYFSFDYDVTDHSQAWWYDEYDYDLGAPLSQLTRVDGPSETYPQGIWRRDFTNGVVYLNSYYQEKRVNLPNRFQKLNASQDRIVNDGGLVDYLLLGPGDGIVLKYVFEIYDAGLLNNATYNIFNLAGEKIKSYTFANKYYKNLERISLSKTGQTRLAVKNNSADLDNNKKLEKINDLPFGRASAINIFNDRNKLIGSFYAYNKEFKCGVKAVMADIDNDGLTEIITMPAYGGPHLKIFDHRGRLKSQLFVDFRDLRARYDIVAADVNNDNIKEILVAVY